MPKVPERPLSKGELLNLEHQRKHHRKPLTIRKLTEKRLKAERKHK